MDAVSSLLGKLGSVGWVVGLKPQATCLCTEYAVD